MVIILYICSSEDGFIADKIGGVGWLPQMGPEEQKNYEDFFASIDMVIMGSHSYEKILSFGMEWPYAGKPSSVFTTRDLKSDRDDITITSVAPKSFVENLTQNNPSIIYKKVWLMGGAKLIKSFVQDKLIDEIILFNISKSLGEGIPLGINFEEDFTLINSTKVGQLQMREFVKKN